MGTLLLSVDFEDWHQLVRRRVGVEHWERTGPALARQTNALLALLDELGARATFFILGLAARSYPGLLETIAAQGHELGCHGDMHEPVHSQTPARFAADLRRARATIEQLTSRSPLGYRAPAFSITPDSAWAFEVLAEVGFRYDSSQHDTPAIRDRVAPARSAPHRLDVPQGQGLWEFPIAVWRAHGMRLPVGGASYWAMLPRPLVLRGLRAAGPLAGLYVHPYEFDPRPLDPALPPRTGRSARAYAALRAGQRNRARRHAGDVLRAIAGRFRLIPYGEAYAELNRGSPARSQALPREGPGIRRSV
jgi:polysaccharide deacetylase family protein (PEP-CTERM system associated)